MPLVFGIQPHVKNALSSPTELLCLKAKFSGLVSSGCDGCVTGACWQQQHGVVVCKLYKVWQPLCHSLLQAPHKQQTSLGSRPGWEMGASVPLPQKRITHRYHPSLFLSCSSCYPVGITSISVYLSLDELGQSAVTGGPPPGHILTQSSLPLTSAPGERSRHYPQTTVCTDASSFKSSGWVHVLRLSFQAGRHICSCLCWESFYVRIFLITVRLPC